MSTTGQTLVNRTRRFLRDWPAIDTITASLTSGATTVTVADTTVYKVNWLIEVEQEVMLVKSLSTATLLSVARAQMGSTAATHANASDILVKPAFFAVEILDALNYGLDATFPLLYQNVTDTSLSILADTYEYTIPSLPSPASTPIPLLYKVELKESGDSAYREINDWEVRRGATPKLKLRRLYNTGDTIRLNGYGPFPHLASVTDTLSSLYPYHAEMPLVEFAGAFLLESGEARRVRVDVGQVDLRENANKVGSSMQASAAILNRFERSILRAAMPPITRHVVSTL